MVGRFRHRALLGTIALGVIGCSDSPTASLPRTVSITPSEIPALCVGQTVTLEASVGGADNRAVAWRSGSPLIASVDSIGVVTALTPGHTWIVATAAADATAKDSVPLSVTPVVSFYDNPSISFDSLRSHNTRTPIDPASVSGVIDIYTTYDFPRCWQGLSVRVRTDDMNVCYAGVVPGHGQFLCIFDTRTINGTVRLRAEIVGTGGPIVASVTHPPLTINNGP